MYLLAGQRSVWGMKYIKQPMKLRSVQFLSGFQKRKVLYTIQTNLCFSPAPVLSMKTKQRKSNVKISLRSIDMVSHKGIFKNMYSFIIPERPLS